MVSLYPKFALLVLLTLGNSVSWAMLPRYSVVLTYQSTK